MQNQTNDPNSGSMINQKFNESSYKEETDSSGLDWKETNNLPDGMQIENIDPVTADNENAEIKIMEEPVMKTYTCPMHPEINTNQPGHCPECGMELVEKQ